VTKLVKNEFQNEFSYALPRRHLLVVFDSLICSVLDQNVSQLLVVKCDGIMERCVTVVIPSVQFIATVYEKLADLQAAILCCKVEQCVPEFVCYVHTLVVASVEVLHLLEVILFDSLQHSKMVAALFISHHLGQAYDECTFTFFFG